VASLIKINICEDLYVDGQASSLRVRRIEKSRTGFRIPVFQNSGSGKIRFAKKNPVSEKSGYRSLSAPDPKSSPFIFGGRNK
jgi:hypothetical protein